jgi:hypothetical protein
MATTSDTMASEGPVPPVDTPSSGDPGDLEPVGRGYEPMSVRGPALIVLGLAVFLLLGGVAASAISSGSNPTFSVRRVVLSDGRNISVGPATAKLHAIVSNAEPPADIIGNLGVPKESIVTGVRNSDQHAAQFDRTALLRSGLTTSEVAEAFTHLFRAVGWKIVYSGPAPQGTPGSTEVLAKHGSGDGFYWETGVVVSPTTPAGVTRYSVEVFETPDGN